MWWLASSTVGCHKYWYRANAQATKLHAALMLSPSFLSTFLLIYPQLWHVAALN